MAVRSVLDLGGGASLLEILSKRPIRCVRNYRAALVLMQMGLVEARSVPEPGQEPGEEHWWTLSITERGRRRLRGYRGTFA